MENVLSKDIILLCGLSSSGKSSIANLLCNLKPSFVKINTKKMNVISDKILSRNYFRKELYNASKLLGKTLLTINDVFLASKNINILVPIAKAIGAKIDGLDPKIYFEILYQTYATELKVIITQNQKCIIDHNIFLDPYPLRKDILLEKLAPNSLAIINIYNSVENILLNTLERNQRFYNFINSGLNREELNNADIKQGFSRTIFRQPLRIIENLASMYNLSSVDDGKALQIISGKTFNKILKIAHYEQEKLIGFLVYKNYAFTHIEDSELLHLRSDFAYLTEINSNFIYIKDKRFIYDLQLITDVNIDQDQLSNCTKSLTEKVIDLRTKQNSELLDFKIDMLWNKCHHNLNLSIKRTKKISNKSYRVFFIDNFADSLALELLINDLITYQDERIIVYLIADNASCKLILNNQNPNNIKMYMVEPISTIKFEEFDNNLVFLARLYSALKLKLKSYTLKFECNNF